MHFSNSPNTAYTLRAYALTLRDIAPFGRNVVYAGNIMYIVDIKAIVFILLNWGYKNNCFYILINNSCMMAKATYKLLIMLGEIAYKED